MLEVCNWWRDRVTLVVDWLFLTQNFGPVLGTYEGFLQLCECRLGGDCTSRWWGHLSTICGHRSFFSLQVVGTLKPSITFGLLPAHSLAPTPTEDVGILKPSITSPGKGERAGSQGSELGRGEQAGARGVSWDEGSKLGARLVSLEQAGARGASWGEGSKLEARGASWK